MKTWMVPAVAAALLLGACGTSVEGSPPGVITADPWVRSTDASERPDMTALFVNMTNPTAEDITLISADCGDVAGMVEVHEMAMVDGGMVMRKAEGGILVPKESQTRGLLRSPHMSDRSGRRTRRRRPQPTGSPRRAEGWIASA